MIEAMTVTQAYLKMLATLNPRKEMPQGLTVNIHAKLEPISDKLMKELNAIPGLEKPRAHWTSLGKMPYFERTTNMTFPVRLYERNRKSLAELAGDPELHSKFSYTARLMAAGQDKNHNLLQWFVARMRTSIAVCPYYWLPFFNVEDSYREVMTGAFLRQRGASVGGFCLAAISFTPVRKTKRVHTKLIIRNWTCSRWLSNLNGIAHLIAALQKELPQWNFGTGLEVYAASVGLDWPREVINRIKIVTERYDG